MVADLFDFYSGGRGILGRVEKTFVEVLDLKPDLCEFIGDDLFVPFGAFDILAGSSFLRLKPEYAAFDLDDKRL